MADIGAGVDERATVKRISGAAAPELPVVPPTSPAAPAREIAGELAPPEAGSKALVAKGADSN